jgi:hypothetical protein
VLGISGQIAAVAQLEQAGIVVVVLLEVFVQDHRPLRAAGEVKNGQLDVAPAGQVGVLVTAARPYRADDQLAVVHHQPLVHKPRLRAIVIQFVELPGPKLFVTVAASTGVQGRLASTANQMADRVGRKIMGICRLRELRDDMRRSLTGQRSPRNWAAARQVNHPFCGLATGVPLWHQHESQPDRSHVCVNHPATF